MFSTYFYELDETAKHCYREKLDKAGLIDDSYVMQEQGIDSVNWQDWPRVEYPDVYNYLIQTPSLYTGERAFVHIKVWMVITFVSKLGFERVCATYTTYARRQTRYWFCQALTKALRLSATPLKPWFAAKMEGTIVCVYCTCMAGLGEACSHIAALLFTLEKKSQHQNITTCTSLTCSWLPPSYQAVHFFALLLVATIISGSALLCLAPGCHHHIRQ